MKIAVAGDSAGVPLVDVIEAHLKAKGMHEVVNLSKPGFYADLAAHVGREVMAATYDRAILCCGTGIGVCISANKVPGIRRKGGQIQHCADHHNGRAGDRAGTRQGDCRYVARLRIRPERRIGSECRGDQQVGGVGAHLCLR